MYQIVCAVCGKTFESAKSFSKYCSAECKKIGLKPSMQKSYKKYVQKKLAERRKEKEKIVGTCKICGSPIEKGTGRMKYCSDECVAIGKRMAIKRHWEKRYKTDKTHAERIDAELKEIRKKSTLDKDIQSLKQDGEKLGLKSYDYGKYAHAKGL